MDESMERIKYDQHHRHQQGWKSADFFLEHGSFLARAGGEEDINKKNWTVEPRCPLLCTHKHKIGSG